MNDLKNFRIIILPMVIFVIMSFALTAAGAKRAVSKSKATIKKTSSKKAVPKGKAKIRIPSLLGKTELQAKNIIKRLGFKVGKIEYQKRGKGKPNTVIKQNPKTGTYAAKGSQIHLLILKTKSLPQGKTIQNKYGGNKISPKTRRGSKPADPKIQKIRKAFYLIFPEPVKNVSIFGSSKKASQTFKYGKKFGVNSSMEKAKGGKLIVKYSNLSGRPYTHEINIGKFKIRARKTGKPGQAPLDRNKRGKRKITSTKPGPRKTPLVRSKGQTGIDVLSVDLVLQSNGFQQITTSVKNNDNKAATMKLFYSYRTETGSWQHWSYYTIPLTPLQEYTTQTNTILPSGSKYFRASVHENNTFTDPVVDEEITSIEMIHQGDIVITDIVPLSTNVNVQIQNNASVPFSSYYVQVLNSAVATPDYFEPAFGHMWSSDEIAPGAAYTSSCNLNMPSGWENGKAKIKVVIYHQTPNLQTQVAERIENLPSYNPSALVPLVKGLTGINILSVDVVLQSSGLQQVTTSVKNNDNKAATMKLFYSHRTETGPWQYWTHYTIPLAPLQPYTTQTNTMLPSGTKYFRASIHENDTFADPVEDEEITSIEMLNLGDIVITDIVPLNTNVNVQIQNNASVPFSSYYVHVLTSEIATPGNFTTAFGHMWSSDEIPPGATYTSSCNLNMPSGWQNGKAKIKVVVYHQTPNLQTQVAERIENLP